MIKDFTMDKQKDIAIFKLGGSGFHQDLHRMCQVIPPQNRHFDGERWHVKYASQYADQLLGWWPEFAVWVMDFENQMELPIYETDGVIVDGVFHPGDPDATGTPDGWPRHEVEAVIINGVRSNIQGSDHDKAVDQPPRVG